MHFEPFEHARFLTEAWRGGPPRHDVGASGFQGARWGEGGLPPVDSAAYDPAALDLGSGGTLHGALAGRFGFSEDQVQVTAGTTGGNLATILAFLEPGSNVVCERPTYTPLAELARGLGAKVRFVDRDPEADWRLDPDRVAQACDGQTALVVLSSPNNPTGAAASEADLRALGEVAEDVDAYVLVDQVYRELTDHAVGARVHPRILSTAGFNKCWGVPSLRTGWVLGEQSAITRIGTVHQLGLLAAPPFGLVMGTRILACEAACRMALERHVATTHDILQSWRATREDVWLPNHLDPGQLVVFPRLQIKDTEHFARDLLQREGLMTVPGELFGLPGHIRIGLGMPAAKLAAGLEVLGRALDDHDDLT